MSVQNLVRIHLVRGKIFQVVNEKPRDCHELIQIDAHGYL